MLGFVNTSGSGFQKYLQIEKPTILGFEIFRIKEGLVPGFFQNFQNEITFGSGFLKTFKEPASNWWLKVSLLTGSFMFENHG